MHSNTKQIILLALKGDPEVTEEKIREVMFDLKDVGYIPRPISEKEAAKILGIPYSTLNHWRNHPDKHKEKFSFSLMINPVSSGVLYDETELKEYIRHRFTKEIQEAS